MSKPVLKKICCLFLCFFLVNANTVKAEDNLSVQLNHVYAKYSDPQTEEGARDVLTEVMEIEGSVMTDLDFEIQLKNTQSDLKYSLVQYRVSDKKYVKLITTTSPTFSVNVADMYEGIPVYLCVDDSNGNNLLVNTASVSTIEWE